MDCVEREWLETQLGITAERKWDGKEGANFGLIGSGEDSEYLFTHDSNDTYGEDSFKGRLHELLCQVPRLIPMPGLVTSLQTARGCGSVCTA